MKETSRTPIESMAALLAEMTERAMEAERRWDAAKEDAAQWYQHYKNVADKLEVANAEKAAQIKENEELRTVLAEYIDKLKGGADNA